MASRTEDSVEGAKVTETEKVVATSTPPQEKKKSNVARTDQLLGAPHGPEISNKDTILKEIDAALGCNKPPAIEYLFVEVRDERVWRYLELSCALAGIYVPFA